MRRLALNISLLILAFCIGVVAAYLPGPRISETIEAQAGDTAPVIPQAAHDDGDGFLRETEEEYPTDEQLSAWQMESFQPIIRRWLDGGNIKDGYIDLVRTDEGALYYDKEADVKMLDVDGD